MNDLAFTVSEAFNRAVSVYKAGKLVEAKQLCQQIIATKPDHVDALYLLGVVQSRLKKNDAALASFDRALAGEPGHAMANLKRADILFKLGRYDDAVASYDRALGLRPSLAVAYHNRGLALHELGRWAEAVASYDRAIALRPSLADAFFSCGNALQKLMRFDEAEVSYSRALALRPDLAEAHVNRGNALQALRRLDGALESFDRALALRPDFAEAHSNRGNVLQEQARFQQALASYDRAIALRPDFAESHLNRGNALRELRRYDEALASYDRALAIRPHYSDALSNRGLVLHQLNRLEEALASFEAAITASPRNADAHFGEAECRLLLGDFDLGWEKYEWRSKGVQLRDSWRSFKQPLWLGQNDIAGKTILLYADQGLGDTIQFSRYVPLVAERGARVILEVQEPLRELMTGLAGAMQVVSRGSALPDFDVQCPLLSLPLAFGTRLATIPSAVPYLRVSPQDVMNWDARLGGKRRPRIGLTWSGSPANPDDRNRSIRLSALLSLLEMDASFVSLQKYVHPDDAPVLNEQSELLHFGNALKDFADTAALISNLDLVISVDTSVVHLVGALAKPVWVMLPYITDWRWLLNRDDSPWYPTVRLFRQDDTRAWDHVITRVQAALREFQQSHS